MTYEDDWDMPSKIDFVLSVAQPFPNRTDQINTDPRFPFDLVPDRATASVYIEGAIMQALYMWDFNVIRDPRNPQKWIRRSRDSRQFIEGLSLGHYVNNGDGDEDEDEDEDGDDDKDKDKDIYDEGSNFVYDHTPEQVIAWRDIWTHPEVYRQVFSDWLPPVYSSRMATSRLSEVAAETSRTREELPPLVPGPDPQNTPIRSEPKRGIHINTNTNTGEDAMDRYTHGPPEQYGHHTHLVPAHEAPVALDRFDEIRKLAALLEARRTKETGRRPSKPKSNLNSNSNLNLKFPEWVVRLEGLGWYLGGFIPSVILWADWAFRVRDRPPSLIPEQRTALNVLAVESDPFLHLGPELGSVWRKAMMYLQYGEFSPPVPLPDIIRFPQELSRALSIPPSPSPSPRLLSPDPRAINDPRTTNRGVHYTLDIIGVQGDERREKERRFLTRNDLGVPRWLEELPRTTYIELYAAATGTDWREAPIGENPVNQVKEWRVITDYLRTLEREHAEILAHASDPEARPPEVHPPERYVPHRQPPNAQPGFYMPWSFIEPIPATPPIPEEEEEGEGGDIPPGSPSNKKFIERVATLNNLQGLKLQHVSIACLETGLAIEEWGRCWSDRQRAAPALPDDPSVIAKAIQYGLSVPGWEDPPRRTLELQNIMVADPAIRHIPRRANDPREAEMRRKAYSWFRIERMWTVESLALYGLAPDRTGRWEDSGIELPPNMERPPTVARPLRFLSINHFGGPAPIHRLNRIWRSFNREQKRYGLPTLGFADKAIHGTLHIYGTLWHHMEALVEARHWRLEKLSPWPVHLNAHWLDLRNFVGRTLSRALIVREFALARARLPHSQWLSELLSAPTRGERRDDDDDGDDDGVYTRFSDVARKTLEWFGVEQNETIRDIATKSPLAAPKLILPASRSAFRSYPNLTLLSFYRNRLVDVPPGLLNLVATTPRQRPQEPPREYLASRGDVMEVYNPAFLPIGCDLSENFIATLSDQTLHGLFDILKKDLILYIQALEVLANIPNHQMEAQRQAMYAVKAYRLNFRMNIAGSPLAIVLGYENRASEDVRFLLRNMLVLAQNPPKEWEEKGIEDAIHRFVDWAGEELGNVNANKKKKGLESVLTDIILELEHGELQAGKQKIREELPLLWETHVALRKVGREYQRNAKAFHAIMERIADKYEDDDRLQRLVGKLNVLRRRRLGVGYVQRRILRYFDLRSPNAFHQHLMTWKNEPHRWLL